MKTLPDWAQAMLEATRSELMAVGGNRDATESHIAWMCDTLMFGLEIDAPRTYREPPTPTNVNFGGHRLRDGAADQIPFGGQGYAGDITARILDAYRHGGGRTRSDRTA